MTGTADHGLGDVNQFDKHLTDGIGTEEFTEISQTAELRDFEYPDHRKNGNDHLNALAGGEDDAEGEKNPEIFGVEPDKIGFVKETEQPGWNKKGQRYQGSKDQIDEYLAYENQKRGPSAARYLHFKSICVVRT
jgi:hypothetical protein